MGEARRGNVGNRLRKGARRRQRAAKKDCESLQTKRRWEGKREDLGPSFLNQIGAENGKIVLILLPVQLTRVRRT